MTLSTETFFLDPSSPGTLQGQIRQNITAAVLAGRLRKGERLPSSRALAQHLGIARITVTLAFQDLVADGYLESRDRSGYYVAPTAPLAEAPRRKTAALPGRINWDGWLDGRYSAARVVEKEPDWQRFTYPFIYGQTDASLFNHTSWRLCAHQALGKRDFHALTTDYGMGDDPMLLDYIARHTLPRRGITAGPENILITIGAQNALWIICQLLLRNGRQAAFENPGYPGLRAILAQHGVHFPVDVDELGLPPANIPESVKLAFVTPSHQAPTTVTMPLARRRQLLALAKLRDMLIVEDDYEFEMSFANAPTPALKSLDDEGRVIYVGSFSKSLFPGLRLGYLVASAEFVAEARALRATMLRHPPGHIQRTVAYFLALGHYDAQINRMRASFKERRAIMRAAIEAEGLVALRGGTSGGTSFWIQAPGGVDSTVLAQSLRREDVLIEPGDPFFAEAGAGAGSYRLAYSSIPTARIAEGVRRIAKMQAELA